MPHDSPSISASGWTQTLTFREIPVFEARTSIAVQCRCGTRIPVGGTLFGLNFVPPSLEDLFRGGVFCSAECIRAFCLESLEILEALDTPNSKSMVTDLHEVHRELEKTLAAIPDRSGFGFRDSRCR